MPLNKLIARLIAIGLVNSCANVKARIDVPVNTSICVICVGTNIVRVDAQGNWYLDFTSHHQLL